MPESLKGRSASTGPVDVAPLGMRLDSPVERAPLHPGYLKPVRDRL